MIGPHEGRELELMLAGEKKLAMFHDKLVSGQSIDEAIIPEKSFAPHVAAGHIRRFQHDIIHKTSADTIRYVFYTLRGEEWRAQAVIRIKNTLFSGARAYDNTDDVIIGRLLGYSEEQIGAYLDHKAKMKEKP